MNFKTYGSVLVLIMLAAGVCADERAAIVTLNPDSLPQPFKNRFSHGKLVPTGAQWLYTAGQTGVDVDGSVGQGIEAQAELAMRNRHNIVIAAGMDSADVVKMAIYYLDPARLEVIVAARNRYFGDKFSPASTTVGVSALARREYLVEVELVAAKMPD